MAKDEIDLRTTRKRIWFLTIRIEGTQKELERQLTERLESFCSRYQNSKWAMNPKIYSGIKDVSTARIVIVLENAVSLLMMRKHFKEADFRLQLSSKSIWPFLSRNEQFTVDFIKTSENWTWDNIIYLPRTTVDDSNPYIININIENLYLSEDSELRDSILRICNNIHI